MIRTIAPLTTSHNRQSSVFVPTMTSTCSPGSGRDPLDRRAGQDLTVDHRLPRHGAGHHGLPPAVRVWVGEQLRLQLRLRRQEPLDTDALPIASRVAGTPSRAARYPAMRNASSADVTW